MRKMRITPSNCPYCGQKLDAVTRSSKQEAPKEDDLTICIACGEILMFGPQLRLKKCTLTPMEIADKIGLVDYGTILLLQEDIQKQKTLKTLFGLDEL